MATYAQTLLPFREAIKRGAQDEEDIIMTNLDDQPIICTEIYRDIKVLDKKAKNKKTMYLFKKLGFFHLFAGFLRCFAAINIPSWFLK